MNGGRTVQPSSFGDAQEILSARYLYSIGNTQRFRTMLTLDASETSSISGVSSSNDIARYRVEPSVSYRLDKNWNLQFLYRYISQKIILSNEDSISNAVFLNLSLRWPKLATTY